MLIAGPGDVAQLGRAPKNLDCVGIVRIGGLGPEAQSGLGAQMGQFPCAMIVTEAGNRKLVHQNPATWGRAGFLFPPAPEGLR
jgi:hypothetical protein